MLPLFALTIFVAASLLFVSEPMFARMVLPLLGGSPSVWNTVMVFYQSALLAGYAYVHFLSQRGFRWRLAHVGLMAAAFFFLPLHVGANQGPPSSGSPIVWLLALMCLTIGPPFLLVATTGPLLQRWFGHTSHGRAADPYFLYSASNAGSLLGLLSYPFVVEPRLTLAQQSRSWSLGYGALLVLVAMCAVLSRRTSVAQGDQRAAGAAPVDRTPVRWRVRLHWVALAFVPSSLMLGVTTHLSMDIIAIPLFWVLPLAIYLLTFILAFARRQVLPFALLPRLFFFSVLGALILLESRAEGPIWLLIGIHLSVLFATGIVCHSLLARNRPHVDDLTEFYLWVAVGGVLGGAFNALLAPVVFRSVAEYPVVLVLACLLMPATPKVPKAGSAATPAAPRVRRDVLVAAAFLAVVAALIFGVQAGGHAWLRPEFLVLLAALCLPLYALRRRPVRFGLALGGLMLLGPLAIGHRGDVLDVERSFFGIHRVAIQRTDAGVMHQLRHGTTVHGLQWADARRSREPLGYYHPLGPAGQIFQTLCRPPRTVAVGVAGLGTGGLSAYSLPGQRWTYFEIDPTVVRIASNPEWFPCLAGAAVRPQVSLGDARLNLVADSSRYDLLVLDAYTSDAIPIHLLTREAFSIYRAHLAPHGVLVLHLSNRYFDLVPFVNTLAADGGLVCRVRNDRDRSREDLNAGLFPSCWAVAARSEGDLGTLVTDPRWQKPPLTRRTHIWTDDFASVIEALR